MPSIKLCVCGEKIDVIRVRCSRCVDQRIAAAMTFSAMDALARVTVEQHFTEFS